MTGEASAIRDDRPFAGRIPLAALFYYSRDRKGCHPQAHLAGYAGILQADAYGGYDALYLAPRSPGPIQEAACWAHARRPFFAMADAEENARREAAGKKELALSPIAIEMVRRIDALFEIERSITGRSAEERLAVRQAQSRPLAEDLKAYMQQQAARLSPGHDLVKAFNYMLRRWPSFTLFLEDTVDRSVTTPVTRPRPSSTGFRTSSSISLRRRVASVGPASRRCQPSVESRMAVPSTRA